MNWYEVWLVNKNGNEKFFESFETLSEAVAFVYDDIVLHEGDVMEVRDDMGHVRHRRRAG